MERLSQEQTDDLTKVFDMLDPRGTGSVETKNLKRFFEVMGRSSENVEEELVKKGVIDDMFSEITKDDPMSFGFDFATFCKVMAPIVLDNPPEQNAQRAFSFFDTEGKGELPTSAFVPPLSNFLTTQKNGTKLSEEAVRKMVRSAGANDKVTLKDFTKVVTSVPS